VLASTLPAIASPAMSTAERLLIIPPWWPRSVGTVSSGQSGSQRYFRPGKPHRDHTRAIFHRLHNKDDSDKSRDSATLRAVEDYTNKYKGEQVEVELFGGEYQDGTLTAYCGIEGVPHIELNGHILIPLQNIASLHCSSRCDAPEPDWPPRGLTGADGEET
jgi:hypothetical protein